MLKKCIAISFIISTYSIVLNAKAVEAISQSNSARQEQRLNDLNQQLQNQTAQKIRVKPKELTQAIEKIIVAETPCIQIKNIKLTPIANQTDDDIKQFSFVITQIKKHPESVLNQCIGTQSLRNIASFAQNELIKKGFITSQVLIDSQEINQGSLHLSIQIGRLHKIRIEGDVLSSWQKSLALPTQEGDIVNIRQLEQGLENFKRVYAVDFQITPAQKKSNKAFAYSDLVIRLKHLKKITIALGLDDSGTQETGKTMGSTRLWLNNPLHLNDVLFLSINHSLDNFHQNLNKNYFVNYQLPFSYYDLGLSFNQYKNQQTVAGINTPLSYVEKGTQANISLSRVISRGSNYKTSVYGKLYHRQNQNFINDIHIGVLHRKTSGWHLGLQQQYYFGDSVIDARIDYRRGMGALNALDAPEESVYDTRGNKLPVEGYSRAPIWRAGISLTTPMVIAGQAANYKLNWQGQYAPKLLVPNDRFYIAGRYSVRGFDGEQMLSGDQGHYIQQEISVNLPVPNTQLYLAVDQGWVSGNNSLLKKQYLLGSVVGLRTLQKGIYVDFFTGKGVVAPESIKKDWITGFNINVSY